MMLAKIILNIVDMPTHEFAGLFRISVFDHFIDIFMMIKDIFMLPLTLIHMRQIFTDTDEEEIIKIAH